MTQFSLYGKKTSEKEQKLIEMIQKLIWEKRKFSLDDNSER